MATTVIFPETGTYVLHLTAADGQVSVYDETTIRVTRAGLRYLPIISHDWTADGS